MLPEAEQQHITLISLTCADSFSAKVLDEAGVFDDIRGNSDLS